MFFRWVAQPPTSSCCYFFWILQLATNQRRWRCPFVANLACATTSFRNTTRRPVICFPNSRGQGERISWPNDLGLSDDYPSLSKSLYVYIYNYVYIYITYYLWFFYVHIQAMCIERESGFACILGVCTIGPYQPM